MADKDKPARPATVILVNPPKIKRDHPPVKFPPRNRNREELAPIAQQLAEDPELMARVRAMVGSGDKALSQSLWDEVASRARSLDPTIRHVEVTSLVLDLVIMTRESN